MDRIKGTLIRKTVKNDKKVILFYFEASFVIGTVAAFGMLSISAAQFRDDLLRHQQQVNKVTFKVLTKF